MVATELLMDEAPTLVLEGLSDPQKRALRLADNKNALSAGWNLEILKGEMSDLFLAELDFDISVTGFSVGEIDVLLDDGVDPGDEAIPAVPTGLVTKVGDIWELGERRIGCGDARDAAFLREVVGEGCSVDASVNSLAGSRKDDLALHPTVKPTAMVQMTFRM